MHSDAEGAHLFFPIATPRKKQAVATEKVIRNSLCLKNAIVERRLRPWSGAHCLAGPIIPDFCCPCCSSWTSRISVCDNKPCNFILSTHLPLVHGLQTTIFTQHFVSRLFRISPHNYTTQKSNLFSLLLLQQFHVGQTNQWQEKEEIDRLFFFPELFFFSRTSSSFSSFPHQQEDCGQRFTSSSDHPCL